MTSAATTREADLAIEVAGLGRSFGSAVVLDGVDLALETGGVFGLLGPNGAGKATTVRILTGVLRPDRAGCVRGSRPRRTAACSGARLGGPAARGERDPAPDLGR